MRVLIAADSAVSPALVPICSHGTKIRDDRPYWHKLEAKPSHSIRLNRYDKMVKPQLGE